MIGLILWDLDDTLFDTTGQLQGSHEFIDMITLFPEVRDVINSVKCMHALVTKGCRELQDRKIGILNIRSLFWKVEVCAQGVDKLTVFENLIRELRLPPQAAVVIGNRIDEEIKYGNMLGCITIQLRHGKYASQQPRVDKEKPLYAVDSYRELMAVLTSLESN
jgi:FMN phosphatase YigB (HAD superfamily)